jgi:predicted naringenin-chalcone synthase
MDRPAILALATGVPPARYAQEEIAAYYIALQGNTRRARAMQAIFERAGVGYRHMAVDDQFFMQPRSTRERNDRYMIEAMALGEATIRRGLESSAYRADEIDDFLVVSCTGFNIPGLDLQLAARLGMRHNLQRACILGMGCYGAFPGLLRAYHAARLDRRALVLAIELCSLHMQMDDSAESVVSAALFSDGAAMALIGTTPGEMSPMPRLVHAATYSDYTTLEHMSFNVTDQGFRMYLSSYVPDLLAANIETFVANLLAPCGLAREAVRFWGIHPGSAKIVDYVGERLHLTPDQTLFSHQVLRDYGNMSSATVLFVLDRIQRDGDPAPGDYGVLMAFGPGLTMEGLLIQWE